MCDAYITVSDQHLEPVIGSMGVWRRESLGQLKASTLMLSENLWWRFASSRTKSSENRKEYWWRVWWCGWKPSQMPHWQSRHCWTRCSSCCSQWALREEATMSKERNAHQLCLAQGHYALRRGQFHLWFTLKNIFQFSTRLDYSATFLGINVSSKQNRKEV